MTSIGLNRKSHRERLSCMRGARLICNYLGQFIYDDERIELQITIQFLYIWFEEASNKIIYWERRKTFFGGFFE